MEGEEEIGYSELCKACESIGMVRSVDNVAAFAKVLDDAGVVLPPLSYTHTHKLSSEATLMTI